MQKKKILAFLGSTTQKSSNRMILEHIATVFEAEMYLDLYDEIDQLPHFNPDLEAKLPTKVADLRNRIKEADGILFATPEYVFSLPGSLKNAIEWNVSTTLFSNKPTGIIVAAASGEKALESLDLILRTIEAKIGAKSTLLLKGMKGKVNTLGQLTDSVAIEAINVLVNSLLESIGSK